MNQFLSRIEVKGQVESTRWINKDIKPIEAQRRTWTSWTFHNYWVLVNANISVYYTGSALIALGLNWWQAIIGIIIGNILATIFVVLNSLPGGFYCIGFPVVNHYVWGMYGSQFVIWNWIFLSLVWYGFQAWVGGECFYIIMMALDPRVEDHIPNHMPKTTGMTTAQFVAYIIFSLISLPVIYIRPHKLAKFFYAASATIIVFFIILLIWALATMGQAGFGTTISSKPSGGNESPNVGWMMMYGIISTIGSIAAGILNQNDYSRFARRPRDAILGQAVSFPLYSIVTSIIGILVAAATESRFNAALWNLPDIFTTLIQEDGSGRTRAAALFAGLALVISQVGVNVPGNALSGGFDLAATFPRYINIRRGAYITAIFSIAVNPWRLVNTATVFLAVLASYAVFLGPMVGLMITSYFIVNKRKICVPDLYIGDSQSIYWYSYGVNWRAPVAWVIGTMPSIPGFISSVDTTITVSSGFTHIYYISFLSGFAITSAVYAFLHYVFPVKKLRAFIDDADTSPAILMRSYKLRWDNEGPMALHLQDQYIAGKGSDGDIEAVEIGLSEIEATKSRDEIKATKQEHTNLLTDR